MNAAVLGANGFLGRNVCFSLLEKGYKVWAVYHKLAENIDNRCTIVHFDAGELTIAIDICFICIGGYDNTRQQFREQQEAIRNFLSRNRVGKIVYASSISVYGNHNDQIKVDTPFNNPSVYGLSKLADEFLVSSFDQYAIVRFTYLYGTGMNSNSMIPKMVERAIKEKLVMLLGTGERCNDYLHINDAADLFIKAGTSNTNETTIGASGVSISNREIAKLIVDRVDGCKLELTGIDNTPSFSFDITRTTKLLEWKPMVNFIDGFSKYIHYASSCLQ
ncbi:MAG: NAD(P)-dependent oxidoreductase [Bacteroidota bacterium]|nr:NAD(P)-dependent oxidoreductase [Bacteroidota bacterium]